MSLSSVSSTALWGMQSAVHRLNGASHAIAVAGMSEPAPDGAASAGLSGDVLARQVVAQRVALYEFKSNLQVFKAEQDMLGSLLDLRA